MSSSSLTMQIRDLKDTTKVSMAVTLCRTFPYRLAVVTFLNNLTTLEHMRRLSGSMQTCERRIAC